MTLRAPAWRATLVRLSWATRKMARSSSGASAGSGASCGRTRSPLRSDACEASATSALRSPSSSSAWGRRPRAISRTSSTPARVASWSSSMACCSRRWRGAVEPLELEHDAGERLSDLVVQLAREPHALVLLGGQRAAPARAPLVLEPVEHRVECVPQVGHLRVGALELEPPAGLVRVDPPHHRRELLERPEHAPQSSRLTARITTTSPTPSTTASAMRRCLGDRGGREREGQRGGDEHACVDGHDPREERHPGTGWRARGRRARGHEAPRSSTGSGAGRPRYCVEHVPAAHGCRCRRRRARGPCTAGRGPRSPCSVPSVEQSHAHEGHAARPRGQWGAVPIAREVLSRAGSPP